MRHSHFYPHRNLQSMAELLQINATSVWTKNSCVDLPYFADWATPTKDGMFLQRMVGIFSSKKLAKFGPFGLHFKVNTSDFIFQRTLTMNLGFGFLPSLGGWEGGGGV